MMLPCVIDVEASGFGRGSYPIEIGFVLLIPLVFIVARRTGVSLIRIGIPLLAGLSVVHGIVRGHRGQLYLRRRRTDAGSQGRLSGTLKSDRDCLPL